MNVRELMPISVTVTQNVKRWTNYISRYIKTVWLNLAVDCKQTPTTAL